MTSIHTTSINAIDHSDNLVKHAPLTSEQKLQIADILKNYDPNSLSSDDVKTINTAFREAGIRPTVGLKDAISTAGFKPEDLRPSIDTKVRGENRPPPPKIDVEQLQSLKNILSNFDLNNLTATEQTDLTSQLQKAGVNNVGNIVDVSA